MKFSLKDFFYLAGAILITIASAYLFSKFEFLSQLGYPGAFLISLFSSASVFFPVPGVAFVFAMAEHLDPLLLGIVSGLGAGLGEISGYMAGYAGHNAVGKTKAYRLHKIKIEKYGAFAIFVLALLPNPAFDFAGIAAGALKMPLWKFLVATILGKIIRFIGISYLGLAASPYY